MLSFIRDGIHNFDFPILGYYNDFGNCNVQLHAGRKTGLNVNTPFMFTIIVTQGYQGTPHLEQFFEKFATSLKLWLELHLSEKIDPASIKWYQVLTYYQNGIWKDVTMQWNVSSNTFHSAEWDEIEPLIRNVIEG